MTSVSGYGERCYVLDPVSRPHAVRVEGYCVMPDAYVLYRSQENLRGGVEEYTKNPILPKRRSIPGILHQDI